MTSVTYRATNITKKIMNLMNDDEFQERASLGSRRVPCGRRSSVRAMIELGELQRRASCLGVLEEFEEVREVERFRRASSSAHEGTTGIAGEVRRRKSNVGDVGAQSKSTTGEFEEHQDEIQEDSRMIQNWEDQRGKSILAQSIVLEELKDI